MSALQVKPNHNAPPPEAPVSKASFRRARTVIIGVMVLAAGIGIWDEVFKYRFFAKRFGIVVPGKIYRSGQISRWMIGPTLEKHDVQIVVDLTSYNADDQHQRAEVETARELGVEHVRFPMSGDGVGGVQQYADVIEILVSCEHESKPVLVHCAAGAQRTGGVVASYRLLVQNKTPEEAIDEMESYGWSGGENAKLLTFLDGQMQELAEILVDKGVIPQVPRPLPVLSQAGSIGSSSQQAAAEGASTERL